MQTAVLTQKQTLPTIQVRPKTIADYISEAKYSIWLSHVWFTSPYLVSLIMAKLAEGVGVEIVLTRRHYDLHAPDGVFDEFLQEGGEIYILPQEHYTPKLAETYCLVDARILIRTKRNHTQKTQDVTGNPTIILLKQYIQHYWRQKYA